MNLNKMEELSMTGKILGGLPFIRMIVSWSSNHINHTCHYVCFSVPPAKTSLSVREDTNLALHFYHEDNAFTSNGVLNITTELKDNSYKAFNEKTKKFYPDKKSVQTGMLQGWNKFCYIGGIAEFRAKLPGAPDKGGLWPACKYDDMTFGNISST